jgi:Fe-S-cluster containining protein
VESTPEPRRTDLRTRFAAARQRLEQAGLLEQLLHPEKFNDEDGRALGLRYFFQGIACPFLEEESCSIHADRPIACREYLVTSPAENCAKPSAETVQCVKLPFKLSNALTRLDPVAPAARFVRWVPLILAPHWAESHPEEPTPRSGPELLRELFERLTAKGPKPPPAPAIAQDNPSEAV